jgi:putative ABC transport system permease protein
VMPPGFSFPNHADAWAPARIRERRDNAFLRVVVRLRPGTPLETLRAQLQAIVSSVGADRMPVVHVQPLLSSMVGDVRFSLLVFLGAVVCVLLIACANVANLLLARAATRPKEMAIRTALGASRARIIRQLLAESLVLAGIGGAIGLLLASALVEIFLAFAPSNIPRLDGPMVDWRVLTFAAALAIATGILFGLAPALRGSRPDLNGALQEGGARVAGSPARNRLRKVLVAGEIALALVLLIGAGLLIKSFVQLRQTPVGFDPSGVLLASVTLPESSYPTTAHVQTFFRDALERLAALPDVGAVGVVNAAPLSDNGVRISGSLTLDGDPAERRGRWGRKIAASGGYFRAAGIPVTRGRLFDDRDTRAGPSVAVVSEGLARALWPGADPIGKRLSVGFSGEPMREVIGVVADVKHDAIEEPLLPAVYQPYDQVSERTRWRLGEMTFVIRSSAPAERVVGNVRAALAQIDPAVPVYDIATAATAVAKRSADPRFYTFLLGSFSVVALMLAGAGIYGLIAYSVRQRTHEIGIRIALGASRSAIVRLIVREGMAPVAAGTIFGLAGAFAVTRTLSGFVYRVSVTDPQTFGTIVVFLVGVALAASYVPARRATDVDPIVALRQE